MLWLNGSSNSYEKMDIELNIQEFILGNKYQKDLGHLGHHFGVGWVLVLEMSEKQCGVYVWRILAMFLLLLRCFGRTNKQDGVRLSMFGGARMSSSQTEVANVPRTKLANVPRQLPYVDKS